MGDTSTLAPPPAPAHHEPEPAPLLVLIDEPTGEPDRPDRVRPDAPLLGLPLIRRSALAARRAGYERMVVISADRELRPLAQDPDEFTVVESWGELAKANAGSRRLVVVSAQVVGEAGWLEQARRAAIAPGGWACAPSGPAIVDGAAAGRALEALAGMGGPLTFDAVCRLLAGSLGPPETMPAAVDAVYVRASADLTPARNRLLRSLVKESDGFMARHVERPISLQISRWLATTNITPNQMTLISLAFGVIGAPFFLSAQPLWQTVGALLFLAHSILDGCDGELARLKYQESRWGGLLDFWGDNIVHVAVFSCMAGGWAEAAGAAWPLIFGAASVFGTIASAGLVYWRVLRAKAETGPLFTSVAAKTPRRLARLLDAASRRDFIYLVIALSLFGKASWFLVAAAIGAPMFFILLLVVALRERRRADEA
jgi:phosphatidylglycerophosphate synthase